MSLYTLINGASAYNTYNTIVLERCTIETGEEESGRWRSHLEKEGLPEQEKAVMESNRPAGALHWKLKFNSGSVLGLSHTMTQL